MRKRYFFIPLIVIITITWVLVWACKHPYGSGIEGITRAVEIPIYISQEMQNSEYDFESDVLFSGTGNIPALTITANKVILAAAGTSAGPVSIKRSFDMGTTWSGNVKTLNSGYSRPFFINCHNGDILLGVTTVDTSSNSSKTIFYKSNDDGATWNVDSSYSVDCTVCSDNKATGYFATYGQGIALRHGGNNNSQKLMFPYFYYATYEKGSEKNKKGMSTAILCSEGGNFSKVNNNSPIGTGSYYDTGETKLIELFDGNILLNTTAYNGVTYWALSSNCGKDWNFTTSANHNENANTKHADFIRYEFNGRDIKPNGSKWALMVHSYSSGNGYDVRMTTNDFNNGDKEGGTNKKYAYTKKIEATSTGGYPAITVLPDGTIGTLVELDNEGIYFKRFNLYWLTGGKEKVDYNSGDASLMFQ